MYCRYLRFKMTCTSPASFPSTFLPLVESKPQNPIAFIISCSSGDLPSRSASVTMGRSPATAFEPLPPLLLPPWPRRDDLDDLVRSFSLSNERDLIERKKMNENLIYNFTFQWILNNCMRNVLHCSIFIPVISITAPTSFASTISIW